MLFVGQEPRPVVRLAAVRVNRCNLLRLATAFRNAEERSARSGSEQDRALAVPGSAAGRGRVAESLDRTAGGVRSLELAGGKETDTTAVGGPERLGGVIGVVDLLGAACIERARPERISAVGGDGHERQALAVRRQG